jgi:hypothetical protein
MNAKLTLALHMARALGIGDLSAKVGTDRDDNFVVNRDGERSAEIDGVAGLGGGGRNTILQNNADPGP